MADPRQSLGHENKKKVAKTAHLGITVGSTGMIALGASAHVISGSIEMFYLRARNAAGLLHVRGRFVVPALIGNVPGGVILVAILNHAPVVGGRRNQHRRIGGLAGSEG
jgi:formate/nitrite transporter FocA (FNT family)